MTTILRARPVIERRIHERASIRPKELEDCVGLVQMPPGSQIVRVTPNSRITNLNFEGGATGASDWAGIRGAVLKFNWDRVTPAEVDGQGLIIPAAHTLMDAGSFEFHRKKLQGMLSKPLQPTELIGLAPETLYLLPACFCHPDQLFLPLGSYTTAVFTENAAAPTESVIVRGGTLYIKEDEIKRFGERPFDLIEALWRQKIISEPPAAISVALRDGGIVTLGQ